MFRILFVGLCLVCLFIGNTIADEGVARPDSHAPIGVMGEHTHNEGEWMVSYRAMYMDMNQNYSGVKRLSINEVHDDFMVAPVEMSMYMHMLGGMYAPSDQVTLMVMVPYVIKHMEHRNRMHRQFSTHTQGIGDVKFSGIFSLEEYFDEKVYFNMGVSVPTGSIDQKDETLVGKDQDLPYPMQLGSGTYDLLPGITYADHYENWGWGGQFRSTIRLGENDHDYTLGDRYGLTSWISYMWAEWISTSVRVDATVWDDIDGADDRLNAMMVQTANSDKQGGERVDVFIGANLIGQGGILKDHRLAFEVGIPVYQHLNGPQLGVGVQGTVGWQKAF